MLCGLDQLASGPFSSLRKRIRGAEFGLLTHPAAVDRLGHSTREVLESLGAVPRVVFGPEHGLDAVAQAEEPVTVAASESDGPRVISLYGDNEESLSPRPEDLDGLELLFIDLADVGSRYYTYIWTALLVARVAAEAGVHVVVLDRANPISGDAGLIEGAPQKDGFLSFVGLEPLPIRHSMTVGEILAYFMARDEKPLGRDGVLSVVPTLGWERLRTAGAWGRPFVMPSPNMPTLETALVYPGGCLLEGTNLSEGRGTTAPFQMVGAPFLDGVALATALRETDLSGCIARPVSFKPTFEKFAGQICSGVMLHVTDPALFRPVRTYLSLVALARAQAPEDFAFRTEPYEFETEIPAFDLLTGSTEARQALMSGAGPDDVVEILAPVGDEWPQTVREAEARAIAAVA